MSAQIIPFIAPKPAMRFCSFCKTSEAQAKTFIASNTSNHCICGECVKKAKQRLEEGAAA